MPAKEPTRDERASAAVRERLTDAHALQKLLPAIQGAAESHRGVYLVGGAVRDLLLDTASFDVDLAVEGDALAFARDLAEALGGEVRPHEQFQTAVIEADGITIDVAATRTESYAQPGALPQVSVAGLAEDLARRDFTINAMASSLRREDLGGTCDPFGGFDDLHAGRVRVLHDASFSDDPTRLLRAVRYQARLGFEIESHTLELAREAITSGRVGEMDSGRVRDELIDLLSENEVVRALERMNELGLDRALHPRLGADDSARALAGKLRQPPARLASLCTTMTPDELGSWLDRLKFSGGERDAVVEAATQAQEIGTRLDASKNLVPSELAKLLRGKSFETLALAGAASPRASELVAEYRERIEPVQLEITGDDLLAAGISEGPALGSALSEVLSLKLDGRVSGRQAELAAALSAAREQ